MWLIAAQYNSICGKRLRVIVESQPDISMSQRLSIKMGFRFCCISVQQNRYITSYLTNLIKSRHMDRRTFIKLSSLRRYASVAVSTGLAGCTVSTSANSQPQTNATFTHGVASGDPLKDAVIIWTRAVPTTDSGPGSGAKSGLAKANILWEMASDADFAQRGK